MSDLSDLDEELVDTSGDNIDNLLTDNMETQVRGDILTTVEG